MSKSKSKSTTTICYPGTKGKVEERPEFSLILTIHIRGKGDSKLAQEHITDWARLLSYTSYGSPYWHWTIDHSDLFARREPATKE